MTCEIAAVEAMYHLQQSASDRRLDNTWGGLKGIQDLLFWTMDE
jgi:hypothetical protein